MLSDRSPPPLDNRAARKGRVSALPPSRPRRVSNPSTWKLFRRRSYGSLPSFIRPSDHAGLDKRSAGLIKVAGLGKANYSFTVDRFCPDRSELVGATQRGY